MTNDKAKNTCQPYSYEIPPATGPIKTLPIDERADNNANCVAVKRESQSVISNATNAAVPMPPAKFSRTITIPIPKRSVL